MLMIDIEASGTDSRVHGILSIGAVDFLNPERQFYGECRLWEGARIMEEALEVNGFTYEEVTDIEKQSEEELLYKFRSWFNEARDHTLAGQNAHFDLSFLIAGCRRNGIDISFAHRIVDLHSIAFYHMVTGGIEPPTHNRRSDIDSNMIMNYVGIPEEPRPHHALNGAIWEAEAIHRLFFNSPLFDVFKDRSIPWVG